MRPVKTAVYTDPFQLRLHIYVVGYPAEGESILIVVSEGKRALLTIVTDCYMTLEGYNHVSEILTTDWNSPSLDAFIWTHPHNDHSKGIMAFLDKHDKKRLAQIISAENSIGYDKHPDTRNYSVIQKYLIRKYAAKQYSFMAYDPYRDCTLNFLLKGNTSDLPSIPFSLDFCAPLAVNGAISSYNKYQKPNKTSLAFKVSVNNVDVFMGGDLDEICVPYIEEGIFQHVNLIKIPHHGSEKTGEIHLRFKANTCEEVHAASTVFTKSKDPKEKILKGYADKGATVHCTGPKAGDAPVENYGCLHYVYDLSNSKFENLFCSKNAYQFAI